MFPLSVLYENNGHLVGSKFDGPWSWWVWLVGGVSFSTNPPKMVRDERFLKMWEGLQKAGFWRATFCLSVDETTCLAHIKKYRMTSKDGTILFLPMKNLARAPVRAVDAGRTTTTSRRASPSCLLLLMGMPHPLHNEGVWNHEFVCPI